MDDVEMLDGITNSSYHCCIFLLMISGQFSIDELVYVLNAYLVEVAEL